jgi:enolase
MQFEKVGARAITDSRGQQTIEVTVNGCVASSPSGKSTGTYESKTYYKDLKTCIGFLHGWHEKVSITRFSDLKKIEHIIKDKFSVDDARMFGGNALFAFESAIIKALAQSQKKQVWQVINSRARKFPRPLGNTIGGGLHSAQFKKHPVFQEFLLIPKEKTFSANVEIMNDIYTQLGRILRVREVNDEGAWHVPLHDESVLESLNAFASAVDFGIDVASSSFYKEQLYSYEPIEYTKEAQIEHIATLAKRYSLLYVEDPLEENDFAGFAELRKLVPDTLVFGDDLTVTHIDRVKRAIKEKAVSGVIVKPNQTGSLLEVQDIVAFCKKHSIKTAFSHRSGETMDAVLADYAFGFGADFIKCGIATPWRECKLQRMIDIEKSLGK